MTHEWMDYLLAALPFFPYKKAVAKALLLHSSSLTIGLVALLSAKTLNGTSTRTPHERSKHHGTI